MRLIYYDCVTRNNVGRLVGTDEFGYNITSPCRAAKESSWKAEYAIRDFSCLLPHLASPKTISVISRKSTRRQNLAAIQHVTPDVRIVRQLELDRRTTVISLSDLLY